MMPAISPSPRRWKCVLLLCPLILVLLALSFVSRPQHISRTGAILRKFGLDKQTLVLGRKDQKYLAGGRNATQKGGPGNGTMEDDEWDSEGDEDIDEDDEDMHTIEFGLPREEYSENITTVPDRGDYRELFSLTTRNRAFIPVHMDGRKAWHANLIPHPTRADEWIVVAAAPGIWGDVVDEITCSAGLMDDVMVCADQPRSLEVEKSVVGKCEGDQAFHNMKTGARDARIFHGYDAPYVLYGSQSQYTCLGQWMQDVRSMLEPFHIEQATGNKLFKGATEIRRPVQRGPIEKNFFLFWDTKGKGYAHYNIWPKRSFAALDFDGSVGEDLAPEAARSDKFCIAQYMPVPLTKQQSIQQSTNSLWITLCKRADPGCKPDDDNTFIINIFQFKTEYWKQHTYDYATYEPYVMLMKRSAPFEIHAIGQRPLWIHGRQDDTESVREESDERQILYVTSMSWKRHGQKYHGYIDDPLWIGFGIDNARPAVIDVLAEDLIVDLAFC